MARFQGLVPLSPSPQEEREKDRTVPFSGLVPLSTEKSTPELTSATPEFERKSEQYYQGLRDAYRFEGVDGAKNYVNARGAPPAPPGAPERGIQEELFAPQEMTLPDGRTVVVDVLTPQAKRAALEAGFSLPGSFAGSIPVRMLFSALGGAFGSAVSETFDKSEEPVKHAMLVAMFSAGAEGVPSLFGKWMGSPSKSLKPDMEAIISELEKFGGRPLPAQATESFGVDLIQTYGESAILAGGVVRGAKRRAEDAGQRAVRAYAEGFAKGDGGELIQAAFEGGRGAWRAAEREAYARVDDVAPFHVTEETRIIERQSKVLGPDGNPLTSQVPVTEPVITGGGIDITRLKELARKQLQPESGLPPSGDVRRIWRHVLNRPDRISFEEAANIRSDLGAAQEPVGGSVRNKVTGPAANGFKILDNQIEQAGRTLNPEALELWREAQAISRQGHEKFNSNLARRIVRNEEPERVFNLLRNSPPSSVNKIRSVVIDTPDGRQKWEQIQGNLVHELLAKSTRDEEVVGTRFISQLDSFGEDRLKAWFPEEPARRRLRMMGRMLRTVESDPDSGAFRMSFRLGQVGGLTLAIMKAAGREGTRAVAKATSVLLTPAAVAYLVKTEPAFKFLVTGFGARPGSRAATTSFLKLYSLLLERDLLEEAESRTPSFESMVDAGLSQ